MLRTVIMFVVVVGICSSLYAQEYDRLVAEAEGKYSTQEYKEALDLYRQAFDQRDGSLPDFYNAACTAALAGEPDIAFAYIDKAMAAGILEKQWLETDEDLVSLRSDPRWEDALAAADARIEALAASFPDTHPERPVIDLPEPRLTGDISVEETLQGRRSTRQYADMPLTIEEISQLLWAAYGLNKPIENAPDFLRGGLRTAPSAGALYPLEVYLVARNVSGLDPGIYWYRSETHHLVAIKDGDRWQEVSDAGLNQPHFETAAAAIVYSAVFERNMRKYGERGRERYVCMDLGHSAENIYLQAYALKIGTCAIGAFSDLALKQAIGMTKEEEPLYIMPLGKVE
jgi:SagB-type dehydrogenase family enzyme